MSNDINYPENFKKWASSFSGCDGGDLNAPIWFCGIEDSGNNNWPDNLDAVIKPEGIENNDKARAKFFQKDNWYDRNVLKLHAAIFGDFDYDELKDGETECYIRINGDDIRSNAKCPPYLAYANNYRAYAKVSEICPTTDRSIFKLNLFPLPFHKADVRDSWNNEHIKKSGFLTQKLYKAWCVEERIKNISSWIPNSGKKPKIIIGTSIEYLSEFVTAFRWNGNINNYMDILVDIKKSECNPTSNNNKSFKCYIHKMKDEPVLLVVPFLGQHQLNSNRDIKSVGKWIQKEVGWPKATA